MASYEMDAVAVGDGREALQMVRTTPPSAVILDVRMPYLDGFEVLSALRSEAPEPRIPVVMLTGCQQETDVLRAFSLGADDYMVKPFSPVELVARLKRLLVRS